MSGVYGESAPLRRRENDSFATALASSIPTGSSIATAPNTSYPWHRLSHHSETEAAVFEDHYVSNFAAAPLLHHSKRTRKRHSFGKNNDPWMVQTAMKAVLLSPVLVVFIWGLVCWTWSSNGGNHNGHEASSSSHSQSTQRKRKRQLHSSSAAATTATTTAAAAASWQAQRPPNVQSLESDSPADWPPQLLDSTRNRLIVQPPLPLPLLTTTTNQVAAAWPALQQQYYYTFPPQQQYAQQSAPKVSTNAVLPMPQANAAAAANAVPIVGSSSSSQQYYYFPNPQQAQQPQQQQQQQQPQQQLYRATSLDSVVDVPPPPFVASSALAARPKAASDGGGGGGTPVRMDPPAVSSSSMSSSQQQHYYYFPNPQQAQQPQQQQQQQQQQLYRATSLDSVVDVPPPPFVASSALAARPKAASDGGRMDPPAVSSSSMSSSQQQHYYYFPNPQQAQPSPLAIENGAAAPPLLPLGPADSISDVAATPALGAALSPPLLHSYLRHGPKNDHNVGHYNRRNGQRNAQEQHVRYFYYDPKAMRHSDHKQQGNGWHLPHFVVDAVTGRKVSLQALSAVAPIVVQPPLNMIHFATLNATNGTNATLYNYTHTHPPVVNTRQKRTLSWPFVLLGNGTTNSNTAASSHRLALLNPNNTTASDKSLLVCTVGVMALLVGAVSARRLRHRSIVWSLCIDTDAAHDHDLYAAPPTATGAGAASYHTFGSGGGGGWRGDLEKFDV
jgi:hypothetical protein